MPKSSASVPSEDKGEGPASSLSVFSRPDTEDGGVSSFSAEGFG